MSRTLSRRLFLKTGAMSVGAAFLGTVSPVGEAAAAEAGSTLGVAQLKILHPTRFRIVQFTDLHFFAGKLSHGSTNKRTSEIMQNMVKAEKPDLVMATGDLWPENRDGMGETYMRHVIQQFELLGVPWAFVWGNHDKLPNYAVGHEAFEKATNSLYRGAASDGNYVIDILGRHNQRVCQLLCLNSHQDGVRIDPTLQKAPIFSDAPTLPRFAFFHIPLKQYDSIWRDGTASGIMGEIPCIEQENGATLPILKSAGVRACFCGHDHVNDYSGVADGVELVYGRATGVGGYGAKLVPKGGKSITVNCKTGRYKWISITPDGRRWAPKPGERIDKTNEKDKG